MALTADARTNRDETTAITLMQEAIQAQRASAHALPATRLEQRLASLRKLRTIIFANTESIQASISEDFGHRSFAETEMLEIIPVLNSIRYACSHLAGWMRPERRPVDIAFQPGTAWIRHEPLGVVGIMAPWNYPLLLTISPLVDAIAAGNRVMMKPSELTPSFSHLLQELVGQNFDPTEITVISGGPDVARRFAGLPFDHLLFTGSTSVGREVMKAAAENLTPVTLELGGKSPAIVCPDYPLDKAARSIAFGKFLNCGQTCIAPDYVLVPADRCEEFAELIIARAKLSYPTIQGNADYTSIINDRQRTRLLSAMDEARAAGATLISTEVMTERLVIAPTVVLNAPSDCSLLQDEIFGPILPIVAYQTLEGALDFIRSRPKPLALYCFSKDKATQQKVLDGATSGGVTINGTLLHIAQDGLPFGGVGTSGMGAYHGRDGFRRLSHARSVYKVGMVNVFERLGPPWGAVAKRVAAILKRR